MSLNLPPRHLLSKSTYMRAHQCQKSLYLNKFFPQYKDPISPQQQMIFNRGSNIGVLARDLFPGGFDATPLRHLDYQEAVARTSEYINQGANVIYEAAFQYEGVLAAIDILVKEEDGWLAYEVKSASKVSGAYITDASLQYFVMNGSGINLKDISIVHLDTSYKRNGNIEVHQLFKITSVLEEVLKNQEKVGERIQQAIVTLKDGKIPEVSIGTHCFEPYTCDFKGHCWKNIPANSIFDLAGMHKITQFEMFHSGMQKIDDIPDGLLGKKQQLQIETHKNPIPVFNKEKINEFISLLNYPLYFMDFETFMPAVPMFEGTSPYQHLPFQYSIHFKLSREAEAKHKGFIADTGSEPSRSFIENLLKDTSVPGTILVYNIAFERSVLSKLKHFFPDLSKDIDDRISRLVDLMHPFTEMHYYHPLMKGSHSIKNVLPALVPELSYDNLPIGNGNSASAAFEALQTETDLVRISETLSALHEYCKLDTFAMVKILEVLESL
jgi:hypothetical protein